MLKSTFVSMFSIDDYHNVMQQRTTEVQLTLYDD